ncbi:hypothetical protein GBA52_010206, partial [Prunus armeniaca]
MGSKVEPSIISFNHSINRSTGFSPFFVSYGYNPKCPLDLAPVPDLKRVTIKAEEFVATLQQIHSTTKQRLEDANVKYKQVADVKHRH